jgi:hypothetical protein
MPPRLIRRYHLLAQRARFREQQFLAGIEGHEIKDPPWLRDETSGPAADPKEQLADPEYVRMKERIAALRAKGPIRPKDESVAQPLV